MKKINKLIKKFNLKYKNKLYLWINLCNNNDKQIILYLKTLDNKKSYSDSSIPLIYNSKTGCINMEIKNINLVLTLIKIIKEINFYCTN
ncbi:hypothetical protein SSYRP_v1c07780 [Spiroplasma syrphidicola EA-1]|uniref:Uncharacterized protein n=1 Tax=Spiroplasma syrphidicola EA-1 TaxID=1276229 RepID=R4U6W0_9MOLU|nr:hypothetical protein SSYRP_v1c07780 [Spiroplasma syrphidicola EA-1]